MLIIKGVTRKPIFWVGFILLSLACIAFTVKFFSKAIPIVNIDIKMDRSSALQKANQMAKKFGWGPTEYRQSASFNVDQMTKIFVELEGGGKNEFVKMIKNELYMPYQWIVRHFKEFKKNEVLIKFTHEGIPYGFNEIISEDKKGVNLETKEAKKIADNEAIKNWNVKLDKYKLIESSKEVKPSNRSDHTFVYERSKEKIGKGFYRLKIVVSGDKVTQLEHLVKKPEDFFNRYKEMRSANNSIAYGAGLAFNLLYLIGGCIIGLLLLLKQRYIIWKAPLIAGTIVALLSLANNINQLPLAWMTYDTARSSKNFLAGYLVQSFIGFLSIFFLLVISFMAAESLTRKAFGNHIQLWKTWSKKNASSIAIAGRTVASYLYVGFFLALVIGTYLFTTKYLGWWLPAGELVDPNILSRYIPWLSSISDSLKAGFWEECLFRAVPLSCAALIGKKYGNRKLWIIGAFILQAIIFGAAHANYPAQPAYARLIELILPSFAFGAIYLAFGLLPSIIIHFVYDVIWMSLPIFLSSSKNAWINQFIVIILTSIPLLIILFARLKTKKWTELPEESLNKSWKPEEKKVKQKQQAIIIRKIFRLNPIMKTTILLFGLAGIISWIYFTPFDHHAKSLNVSQSQAIAIAKKALRDSGIKVPTNWKALPILLGNYTQSTDRKFQHHFIWRSDKKLYKKLLGKYLNTPQWSVRFITFEGNITDRSEQYNVFIGKNGNILRISHRVPEIKKGAKLEKEQARKIAYTQIVQKFKLDPLKLKEVSAEVDKLPNRKNWTFIFSNPEIYSLKKGEARIEIRIDGDEVTNAYRYIHVPEEWRRKERNKESLFNILKTISYLLIFALIIIAFILTTRVTNKFSKSTTIKISLLFSTLIILANLNHFLAILSLFNPIEPFYNQLFVVLGSILLTTLLLSTTVGILFGLISKIKTKTFMSKNFITILIGISTGMMILGSKAFIYFYRPSLQPLWPNFKPLANYISPIAIIYQHIWSFIVYTCLTILFAVALNYLQKTLSNRKIVHQSVLAVLFIIGAITISGIYTIESIPFWMTSSTILGVVTLITYNFIIKFDYSILPLIIGGYTITNCLQQALFTAYSYSFISNIISSFIILLLSIVWFMKLNTKNLSEINC